MLEETSQNDSKSTGLSDRFAYAMPQIVLCAFCITFFILNIHANKINIYIRNIALVMTSLLAIGHLIAAIVAFIECSDYRDANAAEPKTKNETPKEELSRFFKEISIFALLIWGFMFLNERVNFELPYHRELNWVIIMTLSAVFLSHFWVARAKSKEIK